MAWLGFFMSDNDKLVEILKIIEQVLKSPDVTHEEQMRLRKIAAELYVNRHNQMENLEQVLDGFREILKE